MHIVENIQKELAIEPDPAALSEAIELLENDVGQGISKLELLANRGSILSMVNLGSLYLYGRGVAEDCVLGERWMSKAIELNSTEATYLLAIYFYKKNQYGKARELLIKIASKGFGPANCTLGEMCYNGEGAEQNFDAAITYWKIAENAGHLTARHWLSWAYIHEYKGTQYTLLGIVKRICLIPPYVWMKIKHPDSERFR